MTKQLIISGGSRGIGKAAIQHFIKAGWQVTNLSRSNCDIDGVKQLHVDLSDHQQIDTITNILQSTAANADQCCLIHNAGNTIRDTIGRQKIDTLINEFTISIISAATLNNQLVAHMPAGSSILYVGSTLSDSSVPKNASYTTLKHAIAGMMRATCQDLADNGIHTCCICPGFTDTDMLHLSLPTKAAIAWAKSKVGAKRLIEPNEIAELLLFCANNPVINGSLIHANLGLLQS